MSLPRAILTRRTLAALAITLLLAGSAAAAPRARGKPAASYPTGTFSIDGHVVAAKDVLDARAIPDMEGKPSLMVTLTPEAAAAIHPAAGETRLPCTLDGQTLGQSSADALASDHVVQISGDFGDYDATATLARRISGKDPLPDAEGDQ